MHHCAITLSEVQMTWPL